MRLVRDASRRELKRDVAMAGQGVRVQWRHESNLDLSVKTGEGQHKSHQICCLSAGITNWQIMEIALLSQLGQVLLISWTRYNIYIHVYMYSCMCVRVSA